ncbi:hypothetical protein ACVIJ6_003928 [Bradyrhizobium sp. USDA 4369]
MINRHGWMRVLGLAAAAGVVATQALAQTDAQRNAIKSACRSDYMAKCASVPPGGAAAFQCLQKNIAGLSGPCQTAVKALEPAAEAKPPADVKPAAEAKPASAPVVSKPQETEARRPAVETARPVTQPVTPAVPAQPVTAARSEPPSKPAAAKPEPTKPGGPGAAKPTTAGSASPAASTAAVPPATAPAAAAAVPAMVLRPLRPLEELRIMRAACGADARTLCSGIAAGGGRVARCLAANAGALSAGCRGMLAEFAANR